MNMIKFLIIMGLLCGCESVVVKAMSPDSQKIAKLEAELQKVKEKEISDEKLGQYAINMMYKTYEGSKLSNAHKQILARAIVRVANDIFEKEDNKRAFVAVLAIESQFKRFAQSPTGPKGLSQLAKKTFHEAMEDCGVENLQDDDVWETDLNLYAGACYFRKMMDQNNNDPYLAIVAYNQGPQSASLKKYSKSGDLDNTEALKYVAKFSFLKRTTTDEKTANIPFSNELQKTQPKDSKESKKVKK